MTVAPPDTPAPSLLGRELRALTVGSVALVSLTAFEAMAVATAMPTVAAALDGLTEYALAFGLPLATGVVGMVLAGTWSEPRGPAWPMRVGVLGFVAGLLIAATASSMTMVAAGRGVQGLGAGMFSVSLYVVVGRAVPEALRPRFFALFATAWVLPAVIGPAVSGLIVEHLGWRWVFALAIVVAVPAAAVFAALIGAGPVAFAAVMGIAALAAATAVPVAGRARHVGVDGRPGGQAAQRRRGVTVERPALALARPG